MLALKSTLMAQTAIYIFPSTKTIVDKYIMLIPSAKAFVSPATTHIRPD
jgi:formate/nitrite transporter FocA (FNT family)